MKKTTKLLFILGYLAFLSLIVFSLLPKVYAEGDEVEEQPIANVEENEEEARPITIEDLEEAFNDGLRKINQDKIVYNIVTILGAIVAVYALVSPILVKAKKTNLSIENSELKVSTSSENVSKAMESVKEIANTTELLASNTQRSINSITDKLANNQLDFEKMKEEYLQMKDEITAFKNEFEKLENIILTFSSNSSECVKNGIAKEVNRIMEE